MSYQKEKAETLAIIASPKPTIFGKLYLQPWLWKFLLSVENLAANGVLDVTKPSLIRAEIRNRLVTKTQLGAGGDVMNRKKYSSVLRFSMSLQHERSLRVYLTHTAQMDLNTILQKFFVELAHSHVRQAMKKNEMAKTEAEKKTAVSVFYEFLDLYGITNDEIDWESLKKADFRLRDIRGMVTYHEASRKKEVLKKLADGQLLMVL
jgi:hypothetical protein